MVSKGFTKADFVVGGIIISLGTFKALIYAQKKLYICLHFYNAKELLLVDPRVIIRNPIANLSYKTNYRDDRKENQVRAAVAGKEFHNKGKCINEDYTLEQDLQMMINMYKLTGEAGKIKQKVERIFFKVSMRFCSFCKVIILYYEVKISVMLRYWIYPTLSRIQEGA